jgi:hypothetical protein
VGYGETISRRADDDWSYELGGAVDLNLRARTSVPLGFVMAYSQTSLPAGEDVSDIERNTELRVAYTGTNDFLMSLSFTYDVASVPGIDDSVKFWSTIIGLRYYF